jgi:hypothetical protein
MSKVVTPPDIIIEDTVYLIVNADVSDIEMVANWLRIKDKQFTMHLYHDGMADLDWLRSVGKSASTVLVNRHGSDRSCIDTLLDFNEKIKWFGNNQLHTTATDYLVKNG